MTIPNVVVIPTKERRVDLLPRLVADLVEQGDCDDILILDNSAERDAADHLVRDPRVSVLGCPGKLRDAERYQRKRGNGA